MTARSVRIGAAKRCSCIEIILSVRRGRGPSRWLCPLTMGPSHSGVKCEGVSFSRRTRCTAVASSRPHLRQFPADAKVAERANVVARQVPLAVLLQGADEVHQATSPATPSVDLGGAKEKAGGARRLVGWEALTRDEIANDLSGCVEILGARRRVHPGFRPTPARGPAVARRARSPARPTSMRCPCGQ